MENTGIIKHNRHIGVYLIIMIIIIGRELNSVHGHGGTGKRNPQMDSLT